jgi:hypothetical protein
MLPNSAPNPYYRSKTTTSLSTLHKAKPPFNSPLPQHNHKRTITPKNMAQKVYSISKITLTRKDRKGVSKPSSSAIMTSHPNTISRGHRPASSESPSRVYTSPIDQALPPAPLLTDVQEQLKIYSSSSRRSSSSSWSSLVSLGWLREAPRLRADAPATGAEAGTVPECMLVV